MTLKLT